MRYIAQQISDFIYTNIPATWADFDITKTYSLETDDTNLTDASVALYENFYYRSATNGNVGNIPTETLNTNWTKWQVSNRFAMIDLQSQSKSMVDGDDLIIEFKRDYIESIGIGNFEASEVKIDNYNSGNGVVTGLTTPTSTNLSSTIEKGLVFVDGNRIEFATASKTFTASVDTYIDIDSAGTLVFTEVSNGATPPAITGTNQRLSRIITDATSITGVEDLRTLLTVASQSVKYTVNEEVTDYWSYIYEPYSLVVDRGVLIDLVPLGEIVRVTFVKQTQTNIASCGFLIAGTKQYMGDTLSDVDFNFNSFAEKTTDAFGTLDIIKRSVQDLVDFETMINQSETVKIKREIKKVYNDIILFVVDESENSEHENLLTLGTIENAHIVLTSEEKSTVSWSIFESL